MWQPEGAQPTDNDNPQPAPAPEPNQDSEPEPQELPPLQRSSCLCQSVDQLTYAMTAELNHSSPDCKGELFCIKVLFLDAIIFAT